MIWLGSEGVWSEGFDSMSLSMAWLLRRKISCQAKSFNTTPPPGFRSLLIFGKLGSGSGPISQKSASAIKLYPTPPPLLPLKNNKSLKTHVTRPPITAVSRVDFRLHTPIVSGEMNNATAVESAPSQPVERFMRRRKNYLKVKRVDNFNFHLSCAGERNRRRIFWDVREIWKRVFL